MGISPTNKRPGTFAKKHRMRKAVKRRNVAELLDTFIPKHYETDWGESPSGSTYSREYGGLVLTCKIPVLLLDARISYKNTGSTTETVILDVMRYSAGSNRYRDAELYASRKIDIPAGTAEAQLATLNGETLDIVLPPGRYVLGWRFGLAPDVSLLTTTVTDFDDWKDDKFIGAIGSVSSSGGLDANNVNKTCWPYTYELDFKVALKDTTIPYYVLKNLLDASETMSDYENNASHSPKIRAQQMLVENIEGRGGGMLFKTKKATGEADGTAYFYVDFGTLVVNGDTYDAEAQLMGIQVVIDTALDVGISWIKLTLEIAGTTRYELGTILNSDGLRKDFIINANNYSPVILGGNNVKMKVEDANTSTPDQEIERGVITAVVTYLKFEELSVSS